MTDRTPRNETTREKSSRRKPWAPPSRLSAPEPPEGYKINEGWELVRADEYPERDLPTIDDGKYAGIIGTGGLVLARMPLETVKERNDYYRGRTREQMTAVDSDLMKEQHPSMPITNDRQTRVSFGGRNDSSNN